MQLKLNNILNIHKDIPCIILGNSPNMMNFNFAQFNGIIISLSDAIIRGRNNFKSDYWIASNNEFPMPEIDFHLNLINENKNTKFFFADSVAYQNIWDKDLDFLKKNLKVDWLTFDERHFNFKECSPYKNCCKLLSEKNREVTIQEFIYQVFGSNYSLKKSGTVAEFGLMFALLFGCNPIYIQGIELPIMQSQYTRYPDEYSEEILINKTNKIISQKFKKFYMRQFHFKPYLLSLNNKFKNLFKKKTSVFYDEFENIIQNFETLGKIALDNQIDVYNLSEFSNLRKVKTLKFLKYETI